MLRQLLSPRWYLALGGLLLGMTSLQAQPPDLTVSREPYSALGPVTYGRVTYYGARPAYTGYPVVPRDERDVGFVSHYTSAYSPIFFTSINYPGIYGSHVNGVATRLQTTGPRVSFYPPAEGVALRDPVQLTSERLVAQPAETNVARLTVRVPREDAEVYFQGTRMTKTGTVRDFVSPLLLANRDYTYDVRAVWTDRDGHEVTRERQVTVHPGDRLNIDFTTVQESPEPVAAPTLRTLPPPERPER